MSEATIRQQIYTILSAVSNIGRVYDYERWTSDWGRYIELFKTTVNGAAQVRGWELGRKAPITEDETSVKKHTYFLRGVMGVQDAGATEKEFNTLIETVSNTFRNNKELNGAALGHDFIQVETLGTRMFGSVLCHFAELVLTVH